jgi:hypothetical protein
MKLNCSTTKFAIAAIGVAVLATLAYAGTKPATKPQHAASVYQPTVYKGQKLLPFTTDGDGVIYRPTTPTVIGTGIRKAGQPPLRVHTTPGIAYKRGETVTVVVANASAKPVKIWRVEKSRDAFAAFRQTGNGCGGTLAPKDNCIVTYDYLGPYTKGAGQTALVNIYNADGKRIGLGMLLGYVKGDAQ